MSPGDGTVTMPARSRTPDGDLFYGETDLVFVGRDLADFLRDAQERPYGH